MSKFLKIMLIVVAVAAVLIILWYVIKYFQFASQKKTMIDRAKNSGMEIVNEENNSETNKTIFVIYYPKKNPTLSDMKDLAVYLTLEKGKGLNYLSAEVFDSKESAQKFVDLEGANIAQNPDFKQEYKNNMSHLIVMWDTVGWITLSGSGYKYLDNIDLRK